MATVVTRQTWGYADARGHIGKVSVYIAYDGAVATAPGDAESVASNVQVAIAGLSNGALATLSGPQGGQIAPRPYGAALDYIPAEMKLRFRWQAADGTIHSLSIPSPKVADFLADGETAKGSALAALVTAMTTAVNSAKVVSRGGSPFALSLGGHLSGRKFQRKLTIYEKSANLDEPEE